jgi:hypothetical protein
VSASFYCKLCHGHVACLTKRVFARKRPSAKPLSLICVCRLSKCVASLEVNKWHCNKRTHKQPSSCKQANRLIRTDREGWSETESDTLHGKIHTQNSEHFLLNEEGDI